jgi:hypothetical protein
MLAVLMDDLDADERPPEARRHLGVVYLVSAFPSLERQGQMRRSNQQNFRPRVVAISSNLNPTDLVAAAVVVVLDLFSGSTPAPGGPPSNPVAVDGRDGAMEHLSH